MAASVRPVGRRDRIVLRVAAIWTAFVWVVFVRNILHDHTHSFSFKAVHIGLAAVSLAFAVAIWQVAGRLATKRPGTRDPERALR